MRPMSPGKACVVHSAVVDSFDGGRELYGPGGESKGTRRSQQVGEACELVHSCLRQSGVVGGRQQFIVWLETRKSKKSWPPAAGRPSQLTLKQATFNKRSPLEQ